MPYTPYLTDTDRAIDRDTNEMLSPRTNASGASYLAQGYANMDVLPDQLALADMLQRRQQLSMNSRRGRKEQADEDTAAANQEEFDGYSGFVRGTAGMNELDRAKAFRDRSISNPSELNNDLINKSRVVMLAGDRSVLEAKENTLRSRQVDLGMRAVEYDESNWDEQQKLKDMTFSNARKQAELTQSQIGLAKHEIVNGPLTKVGENIAGIDAFGDENRDSRDKLIQLTAELGSNDDPKNRDHIMSLMDITGAMATGRRLKDLHKYQLGREQRTAANLSRASGIDVMNLPEDRKERDSRIAAAIESLAKNPKVGPEALQAYNGYIQKVKAFNDSEDSFSSFSSEFMGSIEEMNNLRLSDDPKAQRQLADKLAVVSANASRQSGYFNHEYQTFEDNEKRRERDSEIAKRDNDMLEKRRLGTLREQRDANAAISAQFRSNMAASKDGFERTKWAQKIVEDGTQDTLGLSTEATVDDVLKYADEKAPPAQPGSSVRDM